MNEDEKRMREHLDSIQFDEPEEWGGEEDLDEGEDDE